jgi:hypothetical protein
VFVVLRTKSKKVKFWFYVIYFITFVALLMAQYTASLVLFILASTLAFLYLKVKSLPAYFLMVFIILFFYINNQIVANGIIQFANAINLESVTPRLKNIAYEIEGTQINKSKKDLRYLNDYNNLRDESINSFNENIFTGGGKIGDHVLWYDILGNYGLIGLIPWLILFYYIFKTRGRLFTSEFKGIFYIILFCLIFIGFSKPFRSFSIIPYITFFIPAILFKIQNWMTNRKLFIKS